ncbi:iron-regulated protein FrpC [Actinobacillus equuli]|nr:iron-regulated protein FrpC [Actinobacillus equuli]
MIDGGAGNDTLYGFGGHDNLFGGEGHDILVGGLGAGDYLSGGVGSDTYIFSGDFGHDVVADKGAKSDFDLIRFTDLNANEVTFSLKGSNLFITDTTDEGNYIEVVNYLNDGANSIEQFDFKDGSATVDVVYNANGSCDICVSYTPLQQEQVNFYA